MQLSVHNLKDWYCVPSILWVLKSHPFHRRKDALKTSPPVLGLDRLNVP